MHRNIYMILCLLIGGLLIQTHSLTAQTIKTVSSGNWYNPAIWDSGTVPTVTDTAVIEEGASVYLPEDASVVNVAQLVVQDTLSVFNLNGSDLTVTGPTLIRKGSLIDNNSDGLVQFKGHFRIDRTGIVDMTSSKTGKLIFEGGITNKGDTMRVGGCRFQGNDQLIGGTRPIYARKEVVIADSIRLTNALKKGFYLGSNLIGQGDMSTFINTEKVVFMGSELPMSPGQVDFTAQFNEVVYESTGNQNIRGTTYYELAIKISPDRNDTYKTLIGGDLVIDSLFELDGKIVFNMNSQNIIAPVEMDVGGIIVNNDTLGTIEVGHLIMGGGRINGALDQPLIVNVAGDLTASSSSQFNDAIVMVTDSVKIDPERTLIVGGISHIQFNHCYVDSAGDLFLKAGIGSTFDFKGEILLDDGQMNLRTGTYVFHDTVRIVGDSAYFQGRDLGAIYTFHKPLEVSGRFGNSSGMFIFGDDILGNQPLVISDSFWVEAGATVVNRNTGGLDIRGEFNGLSETSVFQNAGKLVMSSEDHFEEPMEFGTFDILTHAGNTVVYASLVKNQAVLGGTYYNLGFLNATKTVINGDIEIIGNLIIDAAVRSEEVLDQHKFILNGTEDQFLFGSERGSVQTLEIAKPSGTVYLEDDVTVSGLLVMTSGLIQTGENTLSLSTGGQLEETRSSYVIGRVGSRRDIGSGQSRQFGGLGLSIRASSDNALGQTIVVRTTGKAYKAGQMEKYYEITPTNNVNLNAEVELLYDERDIVGAMEADLYLVHQEPDADHFTLLDESGIDLEANLLTQEGIKSFGIMSAKSLKIPIKAYPSPLRDGEDVTIEVRLPAEQKTYLNVFDRAGRSIARYIFDGQIGKNSFKLENLQLGSGIYFVRVKSGRINGYQTFIKVTD